MISLFDCISGKLVQVDHGFAGIICRSLQRSWTAKMDIYDVAGLLGAALIIIAYLLLQLRKIDADNVWYSAANAAGAALILLSLWFKFNLAAVIIETFWLAISLYGIAAALSRNKQQTDSGE